eukprot:5507416-Prymnesium_polylepis.1
MRRGRGGRYVMGGVCTGVCVLRSDGTRHADGARVGDAQQTLCVCHAPNLGAVPSQRRHPGPRFSASAQGLLPWPAYFGAKSFLMFQCVCHAPNLWGGGAESATAETLCRIRNLT